MNTCLQCSKQFTPIPQSKGIFCSLPCHRKYSKEQPRKEYYKNPKLCAKCNIIISYDKRRNNFCSHSCSATYNNQIRPRKPRVYKNCKNCKKTFDFIHDGKSNMYCDRECVNEWKWNNIKVPQILAGTVDKRPTLKKYLVKEYGHQCAICKQTNWQNEPIPIEMDHVDGNAGNNFPNNLRLLCPNCHAQTPTAKGKNKGFGRKTRGLAAH